MEKPRAALFDLDDTLLDRNTAFEATFRKFYDTNLRSTRQPIGTRRWISSGRSRPTAR